MSGIKHFVRTLAAFIVRYVFWDSFDAYLRVIAETLCTEVSESPDRLLADLSSKEPGRKLVLSFEKLQFTRIQELKDKLIKLELQKAESLGSYNLDHNDRQPVALEVPIEDANEQKAGLSSPDAPGSRCRSCSEAFKGVVALDEEIDAALAKYVTALRNFETLARDSLRLEDYLKTILPASIWYFGASYYLSAPYIPNHPNLIAQKFGDALKVLSEGAGRIREVGREAREERERQRLKTERLAMGLFGGIALIGPVILMVLHSSTKTSLITTSVATFLFALVLAVFGNGLKGQDVLAATAAYAAVLVVFIGTSTASTS